MNTLLLQTSLNGEQGQSHQLANEFIAELGKAQSLEVTTRDFASTQLPHLTQEEMAAWGVDESERDASQAALAQISDELIAEVKNNDLIVLGMPMYNFGVPSNFKAWVDRVARAGITFKYTEQGPVGLIEGKKVVILAARGGMYQGTDKDTQTAYLKDVLAFLGITDVHFIYAEGLNMPGADERKAKALEDIKALAASL